MTAGGYIFEKKNLVYDANSNGKSVARFALEIHKARCEAFLEAAHRSESFGNDLWEPVQTNESDEFLQTLNYTKDSGYVEYYIRDPFSLYSDIDNSSMLYPAFYSFFKNAKTDAEYLILTNHGWKNDGTTALYVNPDFLCYGVSQSNLNTVSIGQSMSHAYAENGFNSYDITDNSFIDTSTTNILATIQPFDFNKTESSIRSSSESLIGRRVNSISNSNLVGYTFQFGYAIKNSHIITLHRRSTNTMWSWAIIGNIIGKFMTGVSDGVAGIMHPYGDGSSYCSEYSVNGASFHSYTADNRVSFMDNNSHTYKKSSTVIKCYYSGDNDSTAYPTMRTSTETPNDGISYISVCIGAALSAYSSEISDSGVDGNGNGCIGYVDTDLIRLISGKLCQTCGATFQGGNFISMKAHTSAQSGYILGWDPSNESIM